MKVSFGEIIFVNETWITDGLIAYMYNTNEYLVTIKENSFKKSTETSNTKTIY